MLSQRAANRALLHQSNGTLGQLSPPDRLIAKELCFRMNPISIESNPVKSIIQTVSDFPVCSYEAGTVIIEEGTRTNALYILKTGKVSIFKGSIPITINATPGAVFGEISILMEVNHSATVKAVEKTELHRIQDPLSYLESHPKLILHISKILAERVFAMTTYLADLKKQYKGNNDHMEMVDEVLEALLHKQPRKIHKSIRPQP